MQQQKCGQSILNINKVYIFTRACQKLYTSSFFPPRASQSSDCDPLMARETKNEKKHRHAQ